LSDDFFNRVSISWMILKILLSHFGVGIVVVVVVVVFVVSGSRVFAPNVEHENGGDEEQTHD